MIDIAVEQCEDLAAILNDFPADIILGDSFAFSALFAAERAGLPLAMLNITNLFARSRDTAPDGLALAPSSTTLGRIRNRFLNWLVLRVLPRDVNRHCNQARARLGLPAVKEMLFELAIHRPRLFLQPTISAFEYPRGDLPSQVHFVGALLPEAPSDFLPPSWWDELKTERPVVLVTQGTLATDPNELLVPAIRGLAGEDVLVVATTGNRPVENIGVTPLPANVRLERFIPFAHILPTLM